MNRDQLPLPAYDTRGHFSRLARRVSTLETRLAELEARARPNEEVTLRGLLPFLPPSWRSRSTVMGLVAEGVITGRKVRGRWIFRPLGVQQEIQLYQLRRAGLINHHP